MEGVESSVEQGSKKCKHFLPIKAKKTKQTNKQKSKQNQHKTKSKQQQQTN